jgi:hypothetical protein
MMGNCHVRFLGERGAAMLLVYPTKLVLYRIYNIKINGRPSGYLYEVLDELELDTNFYGRMYGDQAVFSSSAVLFVRRVGLLPSGFIKNLPLLVCLVRYQLESYTYRRVLKVGYRILSTIIVITE